MRSLRTFQATSAGPKDRMREQPGKVPCPAHSSLWLNNYDFYQGEDRNTINPRRWQY